MKNHRPSLTLRSVDTRDTPAGRIFEVAQLKNSNGTGWHSLRRYPYRAAVLLVRGGGRFKDSLAFETEIQAGDLLLLNPRIGHCYGPPSGTTWDECYVAFEGPIFDALETCGLLNCNRPVWRLGDSLHWLSRLKSIFPSSERPVDAFDQVGAMAAFLLSASAHAEGLAMPGLDRSHSWLTHARQKLETPGNEFRDLSSVARHCGLGYETFRKKFSALMGESPGQYRRRMLIVRAQNLMRDRELPDRAIADALGFCDEFHFSKSFKQVVGLSPRQWRLNETASASTRRSDVTSLPASEKARDKR